MHSFRTLTYLLFYPLSSSLVGRVRFWTHTFIRVSTGRRVPPCGVVKIIETFKAARRRGGFWRDANTSGLPLTEFTFAFVYGIQYRYALSYVGHPSPPERKNSIIIIIIMIMVMIMKVMIMIIRPSAVVVFAAFLYRYQFARFASKPPVPTPVVRYDALLRR